MIDTLHPTDKLDVILKTELNDALNDLKEYIFEGDGYNKINFYRLLVYDDGLFRKADLDIKPIDRWTNAYYWFSAYLNELKKRGISIEGHRQLRFKLLEQMDYVAGPGFDWSVIEKIENEFDLK